jgi:hypothetical protein
VTWDDVDLDLFPNLGKINSCVLKDLYMEVERTEREFCFNIICILCNRHIQLYFIPSICTMIAVCIFSLALL